MLLSLYLMYCKLPVDPYRTMLFTSHREGSLYLPTTSHANTWQAHKHVNNRPFSSQIHHTSNSMELIATAKDSRILGQHCLTLSLYELFRFFFSWKSTLDTCAHLSEEIHRNLLPLSDTKVLIHKQCWHYVLFFSQLLIIVNYLIAFCTTSPST